MFSVNSSNVCVEIEGMEEGEGGVELAAVEVEVGVGVEVEVEVEVDVDVDVNVEAVEVVEEGVSLFKVELRYGGVSSAIGRI